MQRRALTLTRSNEAECRSRRAAMEARIDALSDVPQLDEPARQALTLALVDTLLVADVATLDTALGRLGQLVVRHTDDSLSATTFATGWLSALHAVAYWATERLPASDGVTVHATTLAGRFLSALEASAPRTSSQLRDELQTTDPQISRTGRQLLAAGFVVQRRTGKYVHWELTPRGRQAISPAQSSSGQANPAPQHVQGSAFFLKTHTRPAKSEAARRNNVTSARSGPRLELTVEPAPGGGWVVQGSHRKRPIAKADTKRAALEQAREHLAATDRGGVLNVMGLDGQLQRSGTVTARSRRPR